MPNRMRYGISNGISTPIGAAIALMPFAPFITFCKRAGKSYCGGALNLNLHNPYCLIFNKDSVFYHIILPHFHMKMVLHHMKTPYFHMKMVLHHMKTPYFHMKMVLYH